MVINNPYECHIKLQFDSALLWNVQLLYVLLSEISYVSFQLLILIVSGPAFRIVDYVSYIILCNDSVMK